MLGELALCNDGVATRWVRLPGDDWSDGYFVRANQREIDIHQDLSKTGDVDITLTEYQIKKTLQTVSGVEDDPMSPPAEPEAMKKEDTLAEPEDDPMGVGISIKNDQENETRAAAEQAAAKAEAEARARAEAEKAEAEARARAAAEKAAAEEAEKAAAEARARAEAEKAEAEARARAAAEKAAAEEAEKAAAEARAREAAAKAEEARARAEQAAAEARARAEQAAAEARARAEQEETLKKLWGPNYATLETQMKIAYDKAQKERIRRRQSNIIKNIKVRDADQYQEIGPKRLKLDWTKLDQAAAEARATADPATAAWYAWAENKGYS